MSEIFETLWPTDIFELNDSQISDFEHKPFMVFDKNDFVVMGLLPEEINEIAGEEVVWE